MIQDDENDRKEKRKKVGKRNKIKVKRDKRKTIETATGIYPHPQQNNLP